MASDPQRRRKYWGWGYEDETVSDEERRRLRQLISGAFGVEPGDAPEPLPVEELPLPDSRVDPETALPGWSTSPYDRANHAAGKSYRDILRARAGELENVPDAVAYPANADEVVQVLEWADRNRIAVVPFGGGTSVTGGVEPAVSDRFEGTVSLDLTGLRGVLEVDEVSRLVYAEAGVFGPDLDAALRPHGLTIRHYPQSYYFSTVGGWIATRSGGHYSTLWGKIDERVASVEVVTPDGLRGETRPLPSGSIGPDPNRLWIGSEGSLGVITKARLRVVAEPRFKKSASVSFPDFEIALEAARAILHSGIWPQQIRILDPFEAMMSANLSGGQGEMEAVMILGFESPAHPVDNLLTDTLRITSRYKGTTETTGQDNNGNDTISGWRQTFFRQPYLRDELVGWGLVTDTFETAVTWDRASDFYHYVRQATLDALQTHCGFGGVLCRTTHAYADGIAFYFSFFAPGEEGRRLEQYDAVKRAATDAVIEAGGTASHHHAPWTSQELPDIWRQAFHGAKGKLDPNGIMNPGVIFPDTA